jgi:hypothetical protein
MIGIVLDAEFRSWIGTEYEATGCWSARGSG